MSEGPDFDAIQASSRHGTRSRYKAGCRCEDCRAANADYQRRRREAQRIEPEPLAGTAEMVGRFIGVAVPLGTLMVVIVKQLFRRAPAQVR